MKFLILMIALVSQVGFAQQTHDEILQQFLEQRKQMMEDIMKAFNDDSFFNDDFFDDDDVFKSLRENGFSGLHGFSGAGNNIKVDEKVEKDGTISILITPKNKDTQLDIQTTDSVITIKSEMKVKEENSQGESSSTMMSMSSFTKSIGIPDGYKALTPTQENDSVQISLVPVDKNLIKSGSQTGGKRPLGKVPGEETI